MLRGWGVFFPPPPVYYRYRQLRDVDRDLAMKTFEKNREFYHPICRGMVEKDLLK